MSSDFAQFLFSFACHKLESSPQLDLRQQLLHSNLIRYILLVHQQPASLPTSSSAPPSTPPASPLLSLPPLPPSPPASPAPQLSQQFQQSRQPSPQPFDQYDYPSTPAPCIPPPGQSSAWSSFSFNDELDRIAHTGPSQDHDQDVDMDDHSDPFLFPSPMFLDGSHHNSNSFSFPLYHDQDEFESSQAQEDWLDAILEDLMEEDQDEDSCTEYDSDDTGSSFDECNVQQQGQNVEINVTRAPSVVLVGAGSKDGEDVVIDHLLDRTNCSLLQGRANRPYQPHFHSAPCPPLPHPFESPHPYCQSYLHQSLVKDKGSTGTTTTIATNADSNNVVPPASRLLIVKGVDVDEPMDPHDHHINQLKLQCLSSFYKDDAFYRSCSSSQREDALREQRFVLLKQELGSTLLQDESTLTATVAATEQHCP